MIWLVDLCMWSAEVMLKHVKTTFPDVFAVCPGKHEVVIFMVFRLQKLGFRCFAWHIYEDMSFGHEFQSAGKNCGDTSACPFL